MDSIILWALGGLVSGALFVVLMSRLFLGRRKQGDRDHVVRLEVRANVLHQHVKGDRERPYTSKEIGDALFGAEENEPGDE